MHETIKSITSIVNTIVLITGAYVAYQTFVVKADVGQTERGVETFNTARELFETGPFMLDYLFKADLGDYKTLMEKNDQFVNSLDRALAHYTWVSVCIRIKKCDPELTNELMCSNIINDAQVINRTYVAGIEAGGMFIDRYRLWKFYELVEGCISDKSQLKIDQQSFLSRFDSEIELLKKTNRYMFEDINRRRSDQAKP